MYLLIPQLNRTKMTSSTCIKQVFALIHWQRLSLPLFFICCFAGNIIAQTDPLDSLKSVLKTKLSDRDRAITNLELSQRILENDTLQFRQYNNQAIELARKIDDRKILCKAFLIKGEVEFMTSQYEKALVSLMETALPLAEELNQPNFEAKAYMLAGLIYDHSMDSKRKGIDATLMAVRKYQEAGNQERLAAAYQQVSLKYKRYAMGDSAKFYLDKAMETYEVIDDKLGIATALQTLGMIWIEDNNFVKAADYMIRSLAMCEVIGDKDCIFKNQGNLGVLYEMLGKPEEARKYMLKNLDIDGYTPYVLNLARLYSNLGINYAESQEYKEALYYYQKAIETSQKAQLKADELTAYGGIAEIHLKLNNYDSTHYYLKKMAPLLAQTYVETIAQYYLVSAQLDFSKGNYQSAITSLNEGLEECKDDLLIDGLSEFYKVLADSYERLRNYGKAFSNFKQYALLKDSILNDESQEALFLQKMQYDFDKEKAQIESNNEQQALIQAQNLRDQQYITYTAGGGLVVVLVVALLSYRSAQQRKGANRLLADQNEQISAQKEEIEAQANSLKETNQRLHELSNYKEGLTHMIAHDMKNSLNVVIGLSDNQPDRHATAQIRQSGQLMLQMVTNMLDVQKFEETKMKLHMTNLQLSALLERSKFHIDLLLAAKNISFNNLNDTSLFVYGDKDIINRVLINLLINAAKYSDIGGKILVKAKVKTGRLHIAVSDTGKGIHENALPHIFDKFWQNETKAAGYAQSTGLGLTFCKLAVEAHDGQISVESQLGKGTTFFFDLPLGKPTDEVQNTSPAEAATMQSEISSEELAFLAPFIERVKKLPLYQFGEIQKVLKEIEDRSPSISQWKKRLNQAVMNWDQKLYAELLQIAD